MGEPTPTPAAVLLIAAFSRYDEALDWARDRTVETFGPVAMLSDAFEFDQTAYYDTTMGTGLRKIFFTFDAPFDPAGLPDVKLTANGWEQEYAQLADHPEPRPLNIDPGYLTLGKLVLASTRGNTHRIYLAQGIYAEITLFYRHGRWQPHEWTFPDYHRPEYHKYFTRCRQLLRDEPSENRK
ncbi:MAG: DUF4416 family protein [Candidatus Nealsonbacteria bacterium]|nr:DUF4416 family protein [Candidatus Nealsonbacteria bacterium]